jgi:hypothetical protein
MEPLHAPMGHAGHVDAAVASADADVAVAVPGRLARGTSCAWDVAVVLQGSPWSPGAACGAPSGKEGSVEAYMGCWASCGRRDGLQGRLGVAAVLDQVSQR